MSDIRTNALPIITDVTSDDTVVGNNGGETSGNSVQFRASGFILPSDIGSAVQAWDEDLDTLSSLVVVSDPAVGRLAIGGFEMGDTGFRDVAADITNGWTVSNMTIRRTGNLVDFRATVLDNTAATSDVFYDLPFPGFTPDYTRPFFGSDHSLPDQSPPIYRGRVSTSGTVQADRAVVNTDQRFYVMWTTIQDWPTTLPGV